jgi:thiol-disulfide isomerase/thioredoxin
LSKNRLIVIAAIVLIALAAAYLAYRAWFASPTGGPSVLYFRSDTCPYCKEMTPVVDEIRRKYGRQVNFVYVNVSQDEGEKIGREHGVIGTPTLLLLDSEGRRTNILRGTLPKSIIEQAVRDLVVE